MAAANFNGIANVFGREDVLKMKGCDWHFFQSYKKRVSDAWASWIEIRRASENNVERSLVCQLWCCLPDNAVFVDVSTCSGAVRQVVGMVAHLTTIHVPGFLCNWCSKQQLSWGDTRWVEEFGRDQSIDSSGIVLRSKIKPYLQPRNGRCQQRNLRRRSVSYASFII